MARAVLILGIHREELAFGEAVAAGLDPARIDLLRIPQGVSGARPTQDQAFYYRANHRELYGQILRQVRGRYDLVIDLHCGIHEPGRCADLFSADPLLLGCACSAARRSPGVPPNPIRPVLLGGASPSAQDTPVPPPLRARTVIPEAIWNSPRFRYLGIEVFLASPGPGDPQDWALARGLIDAVLGCAQDRFDEPLEGQPRARPRSR